MPSRTSADRLGEYLHVLRGFGCDEATIEAAHGGLPAGDRLRDRLSAGLADTDPESLYGGLHDALVAAPQGLAVERDADPDAVYESLAEVLDAYGCSLTVDGAARVSVTDADGETRTATVEHPDVAPAPAILGRVASDLLGDVGFRFALLTPRDGEWRALLVERRRLIELQRRFGVRIEVFGEPLLCRDQPADFLEGTATVHFETATGDGSEPDTELATHSVRGSPDRSVSGRSLDVPGVDAGEATAATVVATETDGSLDPDSGTDGVDAGTQRRVDSRAVDALLSRVEDGSAPTGVEDEPAPTDSGAADASGRDPAVGDADAIAAALASSLDRDVLEGTTFVEADDGPELSLDLVSESAGRD